MTWNILFHDLWNHLWRSLRGATQGGTWLHVLVLASCFVAADLVDEAARSSLGWLALVYVCLLVNVIGCHYLGLAGVKPQTVVLARLVGRSVGIVAER